MSKIIKPSGNAVLEDFKNEISALWDALNVVTKVLTDKQKKKFKRLWSSHQKNHISSLRDTIKEDPKALKKAMKYRERIPL